MLAVPPLAALALALLASDVEVTARPEETRCPSRLALAAALDGRVPEQARGWTVRYRVEARTATADDNHVWLELRDDQGDLRLRRELAIPDAGCEAAADGIALIVARFFREVSWTGAVPLPDMERAAEPPPPVAVSPGRPWELQAGLALRREVGLSPGLSLGGRLPFARSWIVDAGVVLQPQPVSQVVGPGRGKLWSLPARLSVRRLLARGSFGIDVGPEVTVAVERAVTSGLESGDGVRLFVAAGAAGSARWAFARGWTFALDFAVGATVLAPAFTAPTAVGPVEMLAPHRVQLVGLAGMARAF